MGTNAYEEAKKLAQQDKQIRISPSDSTFTKQEKYKGDAAGRRN